MLISQCYLNNMKLIMIIYNMNSPGIRLLVEGKKIMRFLHKSIVIFLANKILYIQAHNKELTIYFQSKMIGFNKNYNRSIIHLFI